MATKLTKKIEIDGKMFETWVRDDVDGEFFVIHDGDQVRAPSLKTLKEKLTRMLREDKVRVAVPATMTGDGFGDDLVEVVLTGIHSGSGNVLVKRAGSGRSEQVRDWGDSKFFVATTEAERKEFADLVAAKRRIERLMEAWKSKRKLSAKAAIAAAVEKAIAEPKEEPKTKATKTA